MSGDPEPPPTLADALAALRDGERAPESRADRPHRTRLDDGLTVEVPAPRVLARKWAAAVLSRDVELLRAGASLRARPRGTDQEPTPLDLAGLVAVLRADILALPDRDDAGRPYVDLRRWTAHGDADAVGAYLGEVVRAVRTGAPRWVPPRSIPRPNRPPLSPGERVRVHRERRREAEVKSAESWCGLWLADCPPSGVRVAAPELHAEAAEDIGEWVSLYREDREGYAEENEDGIWPDVPAVPGTKTFYGVADRVIGPRQRTASARVYVVPAPAVATEIVERVARLAWEEQRAYLQDFLARRAETAEERQAA
ncbi:hypothetical protein [Plantactinospora sp. WMMB782]|uniref:hypothetical protein n=1 Tax=Plantactinospora sp. WMMB782 TaxID=3404121 RepID=UPI003B925BAB